jgi:hypothetical protein
VAVTCFAAQTQATYPTKERTMNAEQKTICHKILEEIRRLGRSKAYDLGPFDSLQYMFSMRKLENLRSRYDSEYIAIFARHGLDTSTIAGELDRTWAASRRKIVAKYSFLMMINGPAVMAWDLWSTYRQRSNELAVKICQSVLLLPNMDDSTGHDTAP